MTDDLHLILTPPSILGLHEFLLLCPARQVECLFFLKMSYYIGCILCMRAHMHVCACPGSHLEITGHFVGVNSLLYVGPRD